MVTEPGDGTADHGAARPGQSEPAEAAQAQTGSTSRSGPEPAPAQAQPAWSQVWPPWTYWVRTTLAVVATLLVVAAARRISHVLLLALVAFVLAVGLDPAIQWLGKLRIRRGWAVAIIFVGLVVFLALFVEAADPAAGPGSAAVRRGAARVSRRPATVRRLARQRLPARQPLGRGQAVHRRPSEQDRRVVHRHRWRRRHGVRPRLRRAHRRHPVHLLHGRAAAAVRDHRQAGQPGPPRPRQPAAATLIRQDRRLRLRQPDHVRRLRSHDRSSAARAAHRLRRARSACGPASPT